GCGAFTGTLIAKDGMLYAFTESVSPASLPDFDIECGHYNEFFNTSDAWLVAFDLSTVDIPEVPVSDLIEIYPIPATDWVTISAPDSAVKRLQIYSLDGKLFYSNNSTTQAEFQMDVSRWPMGMYLLQMQLTNGEIYTEKIMATH
ncbi:MAG: T9SS type A sorting domain-containing protein, partial [Chitinophagales bacterium]|nr:T9SS type A sorting domain-containing protein [Chitinophagales bacterium]